MMSEPLGQGRPYVFICYASVDRARVLLLAASIESARIGVWLDQSDITGGVSYGPEITSGIKECQALILMCSATSLASRNVRQEIQLAWRFDRPILPLLLEPVSFPEDLVYWLEGAQWIEVLEPEREDWLTRLLQALTLRGYPGLSDGGRTVTANPLVTAPVLPPNNLPDFAYPLVGRDRELRQMQALMSNARLLTVTGPGGAGKTRLAVEAARRGAPGHSGGLWFVDAAADHHVDELVRSIQSALSVRDEPGESPVDSVVQHLDGQATLLVLDNLEQIPGVAALVSELFARAQDLKIICTSRVPLRTAGEMILTVSGLEVGNAATQMSAVEFAQTPAAALFVAHARAVRPDFALTDGNAGAVAAICSRLDGLPLAIELAAARIRLLPPASLLQRLERGLDMLTRGSASLSGRHRTLRSTIAWSYDLLSEDEQAAFRRLAVFSGGCTLEAAEAIVSGGNALDNLDALAEHNLLQTESSQGDTDDPRLRMLETIREYASEQLAENEEEHMVRHAHGAYFLALAESAAQELETNAHAGILDRLQTDHANLRAALHFFALANDSDGDVRDLQMASGLWRFWWTRGHLSEGLEWLQSALKRRTTAPPEMRASALIAAATLAETRGDYSLAVVALDEAIDLGRQLDDRSILAHALDGRGTVAEAQGDYATARVKYQQALDLYRALDHQRGIAATLHHLSSTATLQGQIEVATSYATEALSHWRRLGEMQAIGYGVQRLGILTFLAGDYGTAIGLYEEGVTIAETLSDQLGIGNGLLNLGSALEMQGDLPGANKCLGQALDVFEAIQDDGGVGYVEYLLGHVARASRDLVKARSFLQRGLDALNNVGDRASVALVLETLGGVALDEDRFEDAARHFGKAEAIRDATGAALPSSRDEEVKRDLNKLRASLSPERLGTLWEAGRAADTIVLR